MRGKMGNDWLCWGRGIFDWIAVMKFDVSDEKLMNLRIGFSAEFARMDEWNEVLSSITDSLDFKCF
jgi:hypothetical protein